MVKNKRGWIRILEATIAVLILSVILVTIYSRNMDNGPSPEDYIYSLQRQILKDIYSRADLRSYALAENTEILNDYAGEKIPTAFNYSLKICNFTSPPTACKLDAANFIATRDKDVYVEEIMISANLESYDPKKIKLFVWERV